MGINGWGPHLAIEHLRAEIWLERISRQLDRLLAVQEQRVPSSSPSPAPVPTTVPFVVGFPIPPNVLTSLLYALWRSNPGLIQPGIFKVVVSVPANSTVTVTVPVLPGTVHLFTGPVRIQSTYYDPAIQIEIVVDDFNLSPPPYLYVLDSADIIHSVLFMYIERYLMARIRNNTAVSFTGSVAVDAMAMDQTFFRRFWLPLMQFGQAMLQRLVDEQGVVG